MATEYEFGGKFERKILALYIREPVKSYSIIEPEYFNSPIHTDIARLVKQLYDKHNIRDSRLSLESLCEVVKGYLGRKRRDVWPEYKNTIKKVFNDDLGDQSVILEQAVAFARERLYRKALVNAEGDVNSRNYDAALQRFDVLKNFGIERDLGIEYWANPNDPSRWKVDRHGNIGTMFLPTLDEMMGGGPGQGELALVIAGGKVGKSTFLGNVAVGGLWQSKNVGIATGELSGEKYRKRLDSMITGRTSGELTKFAHDMELAKKDLNKANREALDDALERMRLMHNQIKGNLYIKQWPTNKGKIKDIEAWVDRLEQDRGVRLDMLIVDYVRTFRPNYSSDEHRMNIGQVSLDLRGIAVERKIPVWSAQQITRAALSKEKFTPSDIAEDISQFWTLDFGIALCQTEQEAKHGEYDPKRGHHQKPEKGRVYLMTARDVARGGMVPILIDRNHFTIKEEKKRKS